MKINVVKDKDLLQGKVKEAQEAIEELTKPKERSPEYVRMFKEHKTELNKINKDGNQCPWEWSYGLDYLVEFLRFMRDYYKLGENVWGMERKDEDPKRYKNVPTRLETLEKTLFHYDRWMNLEEEYVKVIDHPETYKEVDNGDGTVSIEDLGFHCEYKYGSMKRTYKKLHKEQEKHKKKFFMMLSKHMQEWWD